MQENSKTLLSIFEYLKEIKELLQSLLKQNRTKVFKEEWVDGQDITLAHHISPRTLRTLRCTGRLPYTTFNGKYFYKYSDIRDLLESNYFKNHPIKKT